MADADLPPWFGHLAVLHAVDQLDRINNNDEGSTWANIRDRLMQTQAAADHHHHQQPVPLPQAALRAMLSELRGREELMLGVTGQHYTLHSAQPRLPPWFHAAPVLHAVQQLDDENSNHNGSTWADIRDSLLEAVQEQLPPGFVSVLRRFLSVLRQRGHLARGAHGSQHYTVPEPNPDDPIPEFHWGYYLGFSLGYDAGFRRGL